MDAGKFFLQDVADNALYADVCADSELATRSGFSSVWV
jgi:hypothetical protein